MASYLPVPHRDVSNGNNNFESTAEIEDRAIMYTGKVDHRFTDKVSLTGFYLYNKTDEPCANYWEPGLNGANRFIDHGDYLLLRRVHVLALNNTWLPEQQHGADAPLRLDQVHRRRHAVDRRSTRRRWASALRRSARSADPEARSSRSSTSTDYVRARRHRPDAAQLVLVERQRHASRAWPASTR